jgi:hypothetical protein
VSTPTDNLTAQHAEVKTEITRRRRMIRSTRKQMDRTITELHDRSVTEKNRADVAEYRIEQALALLNGQDTEQARRIRAALEGDRR